MPRPSNTQERRAQIAHGLVKVMAKRGYDGASVTDIASAANLTPGLVHYHFKNKQQILLEALRNLTEQHQLALQASLAKAGEDPLRQLEVFIELHLGLGATADPDTLACWILLSGEALRQPEVRVEYEKAIASSIEQLVSIIMRGVAAKVFRNHHPEAAATALVAVIQGYFVLAATARSVIPKGSASESTKRMAEGLLRPSRPLVGRS